MLCRHCARCLLPRPSHTLTLSRTLTSSHPTASPANPPPATSTSAAQPFTTPLTPSPQNNPTTATKPSPPKQSSSHPRSSLLAGTPLQGLAYLKPPAPAPVAREDTEYPPWLWDLLSTPSQNNTKTEGGEGGDAFAKSKKQRRIAAKAARARVGGGGGNGGEDVAVQERSVDLAVDTLGDGGREGGGKGDGGKGDMKGMEEREGLKRAMRRERRGKVREGNFLRGMR